MTTNFTNAQVREMHRLYTEELWPLEAVGERYEISRGTVRELFVAHELHVRTPGISTIALRNLQRAHERHEAIIKAYKKLGSVSETATLIDLPQAYVTRIVQGLDSREVYRRRGDRLVYSDDDLLEALRRAADLLGEPLSIPSFQKVAASLHLPSHSTIIARFGTWSKACKKAGVKSNKSKGKRDWAITKQDCIDAMRECRSALGHNPTYVEYECWARESTGAPSGPTVRTKWGKWLIAYKEAF